MEGTPVASRDKTVRDRALEADQYREAAEQALGQLQWTVTYLYRIHKPELAARLDSNRAHIQAELDALASER